MLLFTSFISDSDNFASAFSALDLSDFEYPYQRNPRTAESAVNNMFKKFIYEVSPRFEPSPLLLNLSNLQFQYVEAHRSPISYRRTISEME